MYRFSYIKNRFRYINAILFVAIVVCLTSVICSCNKEITLQYKADFGGYVLGAVKQSLEYGEDGREVQAFAQTGYQFIEWSDGYKEPVRRDLNVKKSKTYIARFAPLPAITINYSSTVGGKVFGNLTQQVLPGLWATQVDAIADTGYEFVGWDDGLKTTWRLDKAVSDLSVTAIFKKIEYKVEYSAANEGGTICGDLIQTIKYNEDGKSVTAVPKQGYDFICWSDGVMSATRSELSVKNNIHVRAVFASKNAVRFPIIMIFYTEIHATLELKDDVTYYRVDYSMTEEEKRVYDLIPIKLTAKLNDFFAGEVIFEANTYYTKESISRDNLNRGVDAWANYEYGIFTRDVPELQDVIDDYRCIINTIYLKDHNSNSNRSPAHSAAGFGSRKEAEIYADEFLGSLYRQGETANFLMDLTDPDAQMWWDSILETYLHEFAHAAEMYYAYENFEEVAMGLHEVISKYAYNSVYGLEPIKLFLLKQAYIDGQYVGIPKYFWSEEPDW